MQDIISICLVVSLKESFFTSFQAIRCLLITTHCISAYNLKIKRVIVYVSLVHKCLKTCGSHSATCKLKSCFLRMDDLEAQLWF